MSHTISLWSIWSSVGLLYLSVQYFICTEIFLLWFYWKYFHAFGVLLFSFFYAYSLNVRSFRGVSRLPMFCSSLFINWSFTSVVRLNSSTLSFSPDDLFPTWVILSERLSIAVLFSILAFHLLLHQVVFSSVILPLYWILFSYLVNISISFLSWFCSFEVY